MGIAGASFPYRDAGVARLLSRKIASYIVYASRATLLHFSNITILRGVSSVYYESFCDKSKVYQI